MSELQPKNKRGLNWQITELKNSNDNHLWRLGLLAGIICLIAIFFKNFLLVGIIIIGVIALIFNKKEAPQDQLVKLSAKGLLIGREFFPMANLSSFFILEEENILIVKIDRLLSPTLLVPLNNISAEEVRDLLDDFVEEKDEGPSLVERISDFLGL